MARCPEQLSVPPCLGHRPGCPRPRPRLPPHQLLSAASLFQLDALQRHCEILCSQTLSVESAVNTYKYAKVSAMLPAASRGLSSPGASAAAASEGLGGGEPCSPQPRRRASQAGGPGPKG